MSLLFETIKVENGQLCHVAYHNERFNKGRRELFGATRQIDLSSFICIAPQFRQGIWKCKILFDKKIQDIQIEAYMPKKITGLRLVEADEINYAYKYADRSALQALVQQAHLEQPDNEDIIIVRNGFLTDSSYSNLAFWDGKQWVTPDTPLLVGTARTRLIAENRLVQLPIRPEDLHRFEKVVLINAMLDLDPTRAISRDKIRH